MRLKSKATFEETTKGKVYDNVVVEAVENRIKVEYLGDGGGICTVFYNSFESLKNEWEICNEYDSPWKTLIQDDNRIVLDFCNKEEAIKMSKKLNAWSRLIRKGFEFRDWQCSLKKIYFEVPDSFFEDCGRISGETEKDLDILFKKEGEND